jgi:hypothetical protein
MPSKYKALSSIPRIAKILGPENHPVEDIQRQMYNFLNAGLAFVDRRSIT